MSHHLLKWNVHTFLKLPLIDNMVILPKYQTNIITINTINLLGLEGIKIYLTLTRTTTKYST